MRLRLLKYEILGLRREVYERDDEGNSTGVLIKRTYDLKSEAQGV